MADEDKPKRKKIDLKARLSSVRATASMAGAAAPPSSTPDGADPLAFPPPPVGSVPPPNISTAAPSAGILSPFSVQQAEEPKPTAQQQTIKVEVGEEVVAERKKARRLTVLFVVLAAVVTGVLGFMVGGYKASGDVQRAAVAGSKSLATEIEESNRVLADMSDALRQAAEQLGNDQFPAELADLLKQTHVPFTATKLDGKRISGLPGEVLRGLLLYAGGAQDLNDKKEKLYNLLPRFKGPFEKYVAEKKKPVVHFSVVFQATRKGMVAELVPHKKPFAQGSKWPDGYKVVRLVGKKSKDVDVERWKKGDLTGEKLRAIPVEQRTVATFTSEQMVFQFRKALLDTRELVDGVQSARPDQQTEGLLDQGERLAEQLKKIAAAG